MYKFSNERLERGAAEGTHGEHDQDNHQRALDNATRLALVVLSKEEQSGETDLLEVHADKDVLDRAGEEHAARLADLLSVELPDEEVLVHLVEQEERDGGEAVDDRGDDAVCDSWGEGKWKP